ncbi:MAG: molybdopterin-dependent oxidoreductase [Chloroflexi bacterium]|nr:molybdopterin-dependent oxidoreductase [Chloroflexota bacterium]
MSVDKYIFAPQEKAYDFLEQGPTVGKWTTGAAVERLVPTHCPFCGVGCAMYLEVARGRVIGVEPREDHPINEGRLCPKGVVAYQQVNHPDRILRPLIRSNGRLVPASWDEALDLVASKLKEIQTKYGKDAAAVYGGSSITTEKTYLVGKFARVALGTRHCDYNGRLCMTSAAGANLKAFNIDRMANPYADIPLTECLMIVGSNVAETFPVMIHYPWRARDLGAKMIVVDPRETPLARTADIFLQLRPGTDLSLLNGILHVLVKEGFVDRDFVATRTRGFEDVRAVVEKYPPDRVGRECDVPASLVVDAARMWGRASKSMLFHARGIEHHTTGVDNCLAAINIVLATGRIGKPGSGYGTLTGQGNGQGGREHGQKADQLPGQRSIDDPEARRQVAGVWGVAEEELPRAGASAVEMQRLIDEGQIRGLLGICNNSMVSMPDLNWTARALAKLEFYACIDFFLSETASRFADVVLAGSAWAEDEGTTTNMEGRVNRINKAVDPPGDARADWRILCDLARRLGRGQYFSYGSPGDIFDELRLASKGSPRADYYGITYEKIEAQKGVFWPCPSLEHPGTPRLFEERFNHPDGRAVFHAVEYRPPAEVPDEAYPMYLTTGRVVYHYLSGNQTRRLGFLWEEAPEPWVEVHQATAARYGIEGADKVRVKTRRGEVILRALVVNTIRPDTLFVPYHWGAPGAANLLTIAALDPVSKIPEYKTCAAALEKA